MKKLQLTLILLLVLVGKTHGDIVSVTFESTQSIAGDIAGVGFTSSSWSVRLDLDESVLDSDASPELGYFVSPIIAGELKIDGSTYVINASNFVNDELLIYDYSKTGNNLNQIAIYMDAGGINYSAGNGALFPTVFVDNNSLASAAGGTSSLNSNLNDFGFSGNFSFTDLLVNSTDLVNIDFVELDPGSTQVTATLIGVAIPEPAVAVCSLLGILGLVASRRRSNNSVASAS